jgi:MFS family permease
MMLGMTLIPFFVKGIGGDERSVAIAYGVQMVALGATCLISAPFLTRVKNGLPWCLLGISGFGIFYAVAMFSPSPIFFFFLTGLAMCFFALAWPALQSWLGAQPDEKLRTKSFSYFNIAIGLGLVAGPFIAGILYDINYRYAFFAVFLTSALAGFLIFLLPNEKKYFGTVASDIADDVNSDADRNKINESFLYTGWFCCLLAWGLVGAVRTVYASQVENLVETSSMVLLSQTMPLHTFGADGSIGAARLYSWMQSILSAGYFLCVVIMGRTTRWQHRFGLIIVFELVVAATVWFLSTSSSLIAIMFCHVILGAFTGFGYLSSQCYSVANPLLKHRRIAINEGLANTSGLIVPLIFAQLSMSLGLLWPFSWTPVFMLGAIIMQFFLLHYGKWKFMSIRSN